MRTLISRLNAYPTWKRALLSLGLAVLIFLSWAIPRILQWHRLPSYGIGDSCPISRERVASQSTNYSTLPHVWQRTHLNGGVVLYYGSAHTRDPADPQLTDINLRWKQFRPTLALLEGFMGRLFPIGIHPVREFGEMGHVYRLGLKDDVPLYSWEIPVEQDVALLSEVFPAKQIATYYILRPYFGQQRFSRPASPEDFVREYVEKRTRIAGLQNTFRSVEDLDAFWQESFPQGPAWRDVSDLEPLPGYLADIFLATNIARDWYSACAIMNALERGERVFVIGGGSHSVRLENIFDDLFGRE